MLSLSSTSTTTGPVASIGFRAKLRERRLQPRHADGKAGGRHALAGEARDEIVVAPAAADGAEAHGPPVIAFDLERQLSLEHEAGVVFEPAND